MYITTLTPDLALVDALAEAAPKAPDVMSAYVESTVKPAIQQRVDTTVALYPPQRIPWGNGFATDKSRRWYFANRVPRGSRGGSYARTGDLAKAWVVRIDRRSKEEIIRVANTDPAAGYVYGPGNALASFRQVPGHALTGWGSGFDQMFAELADFSMGQLLDAWNATLDAILKGDVR